MYVIAVGTPFDGLTLIGPFATTDAAIITAAELSAAWEVVEVQPVNEARGEAVSHVGFAHSAAGPIPLDPDLPSDEEGRRMRRERFRRATANTDPFNG